MSTEELEDKIRESFEDIGRFILYCKTMYLYDKALLDEWALEEVKPDFIVE